MGVVSSSISREFCAPNDGISRSTQNGASLLCECGADPRSPCGCSRGDGVDDDVTPSARLVEFLAECHSRGCVEPLSRARYQRLVEAVVELSQSSDFAHAWPERAPERTQADIGIRRRPVRTALEELSEVLPALGIHVDPASPLRCCDLGEAPLGRSEAASPSSRALAAVLAEEDFATFDDLAFGRGERDGGVEVDAHLLQRAHLIPFDLLERFQIPANAQVRWIMAIAEQYAANAYHNWRHAVDVTQFSHLALTRGGLAEHLTHQDILAFLVAAIGHDVAHTGTNNAFLIKTCDTLALVYNDRSPLENMHAHVTFQTLRRPGLDFFSGVDESQYRNLRAKIVDCILATDMASHFELVDKFEVLSEQLHREKTVQPAASAQSIMGGTMCKTESLGNEGQHRGKAERKLLLQAFVHMADMGHCCRPWDFHRHLVAALEEEFFSQGDQEKALGIPIMPLMDRSKDSAAASQSFFVEQIVRPLLAPFTNLLTAGGDLAKELEANTSGNLVRWQKLLQEHGRKTARELVDLEVRGEEAKDSGESAAGHRTAPDASSSALAPVELERAPSPQQQPELPITCAREAAAAGDSVSTEPVSSRESRPAG
eukprot:TRINITY_DN8615_c0_g1_i1.p1 TRINITY_DN8615_c0_g1~~TRINITY_DN8615_c0_g1_i1.p1  ORF type:complete len:601 (-),score=110.48 TRINITY_DN8615_c0_g1_i1:1196-2998(-)